MSHYNNNYMNTKISYEEERKNTCLEMKIVDTRIHQICKGKWNDNPA